MNDRISRLEDEIYGETDTDPGLKGRVFKVEEAVSKLPGLQKKMDVSLIVSTVTFLAVIRPNLVDAVDWLFKLLNI